MAAHLAPELPLQLRPLLLGLAADSLGFALVQETLGESWRHGGRHLEDFHIFHRRSSNLLLALPQSADNDPHVIF